MPGRYASQTYPAVVTVMLVLAFVFTITAIFRPLIPPPDLNPIAKQRGGFLQQSKNQKVRWRSLRDKPYAEGKRSDRPLLVVAGEEWNQTSRFFDQAIFADNDVAERLNHEFIPVRVDTAENPEWFSSPVQLIMASQQIDPGWWCGVFQPDGKLIGWVGQSSGNLKYDANGFQSFLSQCLKVDRTNGRSGNKELQPMIDTQEKFLLGKMQGAGKDLSDYYSSIQGLVTSSQSFLEGNYSKLYPWEWRMVLSHPDGQIFIHNLESKLTTSCVDWVYGGFFRLDSRTSPCYDKTAMENADMAAVLALAGASSNSLPLKVMAKRTAQSVLDQFFVDGQVYGCINVTADPLGRSPAHSLNPSSMERNLDAHQKSFARENFRLDFGENPRLIPILKHLNDFVQNQVEYDEFIKKWRTLVDSGSLNRSQANYAYVTCQVYARLAEVARLLGDKDLKEAIEPLFQVVSSFRVGPEDVLHSRDNQVELGSFLQDYVGFSDACFQRFLLSGDQKALEYGGKVLDRATEIFKIPGSNVLGQVASSRVLPDSRWTLWPNIIDSIHASTQSDLLRVMHCYSVLYRDKEQGQLKRQWTLEQVGIFSPITDQLKLRLGGLVTAMSQIVSDQYAVVMGPSAVERAAALSKLNPGVLVIPGSKGLRNDIKANNGVALFERGVLQGVYPDDLVLTKLQQSP